MKPAAKVGLRIAAVSLLLIGITCFLIEADVIYWTRGYLLPPILALYVGVEVLALLTRGRGQRSN